MRTAGTQGEGRTHRGLRAAWGLHMMCQRGGDPPRAQDERGRALIPRGRLSSQTQLQRPVLTGSGLGQAGNAGDSQQRLGEGVRPGLCSWSSSSCDSACMSPASWGPRASITDRPYLEQRYLEMLGLSWGGGTQLGRTVKRWGARTLVLRAVCAAQRLEGSEGRRFPCSPPRLSGSKAPPQGTCSLVL